MSDSVCPTCGYYEWVHGPGIERPGWCRDIGRLRAEVRDLKAGVTAPDREAVQEALDRLEAVWAATTGPTEDSEGWAQAVYFSVEALTRALVATPASAPSDGGLREAELDAIETFCARSPLCTTSVRRGEPIDATAFHEWNAVIECQRMCIHVEDCDLATTGDES